MLNTLRLTFYFCCVFLVMPLYGQQKKLSASVPSFAPFYFNNPEFDAKISFNECQGAGIEILTLIAQDLPIKFNFEQYPYARILHNLQSGKLDLALIFKNTSIANSIEYIGPVSKSRVVILTSSTQPIKTYQELSQLKAIAVIRNASFENTFDQDKNLKKVSVNSYHQALKMFILGRVDAVVGSIVGLEYESSLQQLKIAQLNVFELGKKEWWLHFSKKSSFQYLKPQLERAVQKIYQEDLVTQIYHQQMDKCPNLTKNH